MGLLVGILMLLMNAEGDLKYGALYNDSAAHTRESTVEAGELSRTLLQVPDRVSASSRNFGKLSVSRVSVAAAGGPSEPVGPPKQSQ